MVHVDGEVCGGWVSYENKLICVLYRGSNGF